jgi:8-oxo-dGTP diphosphatase
MKLATLCYVRHEGNTLMIHRNKRIDDMHLGKWNGLGGKFTPGETPEECVIREVEEESGLKIKNPQLHGFLTFPKFSAGEDWYVFVFTAQEFEGKLSQSEEGELRWIPDKKLFDLNLWDGDKYFLPLLNTNKHFSGKFIYRKGSLIDYSISIYE